MKVGRLDERRGAENVGEQRLRGFCHIGARTNSHPDCKRRYVLVALNHEIRVGGFQLWESVKCVDEEYGEGAESVPMMEMACACQLWAQPSEGVSPFLVQRARSVSD